jgi:hypothetical protein
MQSMANATTMPLGGYDASHISQSQWSILVASSKTPKSCHRVSAHAVLPRRPPWSSMTATQQTHQKTQLLASDFDTFYLAKVVIFVTQDGPPTQVIDATSSVEM